MNLDSGYVVYSDEKSVPGLFLAAGASGIVRTSQGLAVDSLFGGDISLAEYYYASIALERAGVYSRILGELDDAGDWAISEQGGQFLTVNGGGTLTIFDKSGGVYLVSSDDLVVYNLNGTIKILGVPIGGGVNIHALFRFRHADLDVAWQKPIEEIRPDDLVLSFDDDGNLQPGRVIRLFRNTAPHILDFWGTGVTPGDAYLCGGGACKGRHMAILDILRRDGAIGREDGTLIRATTGCEVGSTGDRMVTAIVGERQPDGQTKVQEVGEIRFGARIITGDGQDRSVGDLVFAAGGMLNEAGFIVTEADGEPMPFVWTFGPSLPKPEDYILQRSDVTLAEIEAAAIQVSFGVPPSIPRGDNAPPHRNAHLRDTSVVPNLPPAFARHPDAPGSRGAKTRPVWRSAF